METMPRACSASWYLSPAVRGAAGERCSRCGGISRPAPVARRDLARMLDLDASLRVRGGSWVVRQVGVGEEEQERWGCIAAGANGC
ncbi:hypothetical protein GQ55_9G125200 [Panicum hallii var. hallii]|uniref:Uncharacterized protein n=1 Tax=Panicum hallii var. hallii TaxID=1504633 RepID=A0A2T7C2H2_9POAL|nr:hypothetical protein GQ55_9G125200 [Panicum hallii var. hallii]